MNIFSPLDTTIIHWMIPAGAGLSWQAGPGEEIIDRPTKKKLVHVSYYNSYSAIPVNIVVGRRKEDGALSFTPGLLIKFDGEDEFMVTDEIPTKILMEPEFSLEEIEQAKEVMDNLQ